MGRVHGGETQPPHLRDPLQNQPRLFSHIRYRKHGLGTLFSSKTPSPSKVSFEQTSPSVNSTHRPRRLCFRRIPCLPYSLQRAEDHKREDGEEERSFHQRRHEGRSEGASQ